MKRVIILLSFAMASFNGFSQKHAVILPEFSIVLPQKGNNQSTSAGGSVSFGARIANSFIHPVIGINDVFQKDNMPTIHVGVLLCDDKAKKLSPCFMAKTGINTENKYVVIANKAGYIKGGLYLNGEAGIILPNKNLKAPRPTIMFGYSQIKFATNVANVSTKSTSAFYSLSFGMKI